MITKEQIDAITEIIKDKAFVRDSHIDFSIRIIGYGRTHKCASKEAAVQNQHDECKDSVDFCARYQVYSSHSPCCHEVFSEIDEALQCLRAL